MLCDAILINLIASANNNNNNNNHVKEKMLAERLDKKVVS